MKNRLLRNWAILLGSVSAFLFLFTIFGAGVVKADNKVPSQSDLSNGFIIDAEWVDRAHIKITRFEFKDDGSNVNHLFSDDGNEQLGMGVKYVNQYLNDNFVGKEFTSHNVAPDEADHTKWFLNTGCGSDSAIFMDQPNISEITGVPQKSVVWLHSNDLWVKPRVVPGRGGDPDCVNPIANGPKNTSIRDTQLEFYPAKFDPNAKIYYVQSGSDTGTLNRADNVDNGTVKIKDTNNKRLYEGNKVKDCTVSFTFKNDPVVGDNNDGTIQTCAGDNSSFGVFASITNVADLTKPPGTNGGGAAGPPGSECEKKLGDPLTWFMCPLIDAGKLAVQTLDNAITSQLTINTSGNCSVYDETGAGCTDPNNSPGKALFNVWGAFRYMALGVLVIVGLVMIISQALSFGIFDAYTIKKVLPKILIGVIGISVSWYLCKFAIEFFNALGLGVRSLLYGPFQNIGAVKFDAGAVSLLAIGTGVAVVGLGIVGILSFIVTALLAVIIAFGVLVFRQIMIILLVVTAPIAIVCWILPNTEKAWKMWWDFFIRALVVFPIIALFIAGGRVIAQIATLNSGQPGQSNFLGSCIAFIAYFGPYFALPAAFRLAGGAIATVGGVVNDRGRGAFDRLKQGRSNRMKDRVSRATQGGIYDKNTRRGRFGNRVAGTMFEPHNYAALYGSKVLDKAHWKKNPLSKRAAQIGHGISDQTVEETLKGFQHVNNNGANDKMYMALHGQHRFKGINKKTDKSTMQELEAAGLAGKVPTSYNDMMKMGEIMQNSSDETERIGGLALQGNAGYLSTLNSNADTTLASIQGIGAMGHAQHGFGTADDLTGVYNSMKSNDRFGANTAQAIISKGQLLSQDKRLDNKLGYGVLVGANGEARSVFQNPARLSQLISTIKPHDFAGAKGGSVRDMAWENVQRKDAQGNLMFDDHGFAVTDRKARTGGLIDMAIGKADMDGNGKIISRDAQKEVHDKIVVGASRYGPGDADAKLAWRDMAVQVDKETAAQFARGEISEDRVTNLQSQIGIADDAIAEQQARGMEGGPSGGVAPDAPPPGAGPAPGS